MNVHRLGLNHDDGLMLLGSFGAGHQLQRASMKADGTFHIHAPLLNVDRHPWKLEFLQGGLKGGVRGAPG